jgi:hypothetical protein
MQQKYAMFLLIAALLCDVPIYLNTRKWCSVLVATQIFDFLC